MTKKENLENETYIVDAPKQSKLRNWLGGRTAKITAISVGSALAIGAAFTGGVVAAKTVLPQKDGPGFAESFDHDGDRFGDPAGDRPAPLDGHRPPKPGHDFEPTPSTTTP